MWIGAIVVEDPNNFPVTVVETETFRKDAAGIFSEEELARIKFGLAINPEAGDVVPGTGGVRKVRVPALGRGKSRGARVIYFYHDRSIPIALLGVYTKNRKADLTADETKMVRRLVQELIREFGGAGTGT